MTVNQSDEIYDYYARFLSFLMPPGLYVLNGQRIWTPIDTGRLEVSFLVSVPKDGTPVYGLCLFKYSWVFYSPHYIIVFAGCIKTNVGFRFLSSIRGFRVFDDGRSQPKPPKKRPALNWYSNPENINTEHTVIACPGVKPEKELIFIFAGSSPTVNLTEPSSSSSDDEDEVYDEEADDYQTM